MLILQVFGRIHQRNCLSWTFFFESILITVSVSLVVYSAEIFLFLFESILVICMFIRICPFHLYYLFLVTIKKFFKFKYS